MIITQRIIYGDVLLVINFSMDFLSLYITAKIMRLKINPCGMTVAASIGALYSLIALYLNSSSLVNGMISVAVSFLLCLAAYGKTRFKYFLKNASVFYIVNFALGGGITAVCNVLNMWKNRRDLWVNGTYNVLYGDISFGLLFLLAALCGAFSLISGRLIKKQKAIKSAELKISIGKNTVSLRGLVDSGNLLKEPISGKPVIIASYDKMRSVLPPELLNIFKTNDLSTPTLPYMYKIRLVPLSTVGGSGLAIALRPENVRVDERSVDAYVAIDAAKKEYDGFSAIIPAILAE